MQINNAIKCNAVFFLQAMSGQQQTLATCLINKENKRQGLYEAGGYRRQFGFRILISDAWNAKC